ncbi:hypothetical protein HZB88_02035 [archaeon]|nr:hypothetical protein [archaeon]
MGLFSSAKNSLCMLLAGLLFNSAVLSGCATTYYWRTESPYLETKIESEKTTLIDYSIIPKELNRGRLDISVARLEKLAEFEKKVVNTYEQEAEYAEHTSPNPWLYVGLLGMGIGGPMIGASLDDDTGTLAISGIVMAGLGVVFCFAALLSPKKTETPTGNTRVSPQPINTRVEGEPDMSNLKEIGSYPATQLPIDFYSACFSFDGKGQSYSAATDNYGKLSVKLVPVSSFSYTKEGLKWTKSAQKIIVEYGERGLYEALEKAQPVKCSIEIQTKATDGENDSETLEVNGYILHPYENCICFNVL